MTKRWFTDWYSLDFTFCPKIGTLSGLVILLQILENQENPKVINRAEAPAPSGTSEIVGNPFKSLLELVLALEHLWEPYIGEPQGPQHTVTAQESSRTYLRSKD